MNLYIFAAMKEDGQREVLLNYEKRIRKCSEELTVNKSLSTRYSYIRLIIFILAIPIIYFLTLTTVPFVVIGIIALIVAFVQAVLRQQKYDKLAKGAENLIAINENEISCITSFSNLYYDGSKFREAHNLYSDDLDIYGPNSLFALINRAKSFHGTTYLRDSLSIKPTVAEVLERQAAIRELSAGLEWRQSFANTLYNIEGGHDRNLAQEIDHELDVDLSFTSTKAISVYINGVPYAWIVLLVVYFINSDLATSLASILFVVNLLFTLRKAGETSSIQTHLSNASMMLKSYKDAVSIIFKREWTSSLLRGKVETFRSSSDKQGSVRVLSDLQNIIEHLDYRLNFIPAILLNGFVLWDFRVLRRLDQWRKKHKGALTQLLEFVGLMEGNVSLATLAYNNPQYEYPSVHNEYFSLDAVEIEHPLIAKGENVANDFRIEKSQHLSIITGSNMSGKSTLLRTIGINIILGYTGTKVAARSFSYPIVTLISYMRIKDILEESVSTFKAELNRIQLILEMLTKDPHCFILIDEMLRGTNSKDKLTGSISIAKRLLGEKTYAMIATHDIKLAELGNEVDYGISNFYFDIEYAAGDLVFDYKVKKGICENFNASFLLKQLGIELDD